MNVIFAIENVYICLMIVKLFANCNVVVMSDNIENIDKSQIDDGKSGIIVQVKSLANTNTNDSINFGDGDHGNVNVNANVKQVSPGGGGTSMMMLNAAESTSTDTPLVHYIMLSSLVMLPLMLLPALFVFAIRRARRHTTMISSLPPPTPGSEQQMMMMMIPKNDVEHLVEITEKDGGKILIPIVPTDKLSICCGGGNYDGEGDDDEPPPPASFICVDKRTGTQFYHLSDDAIVCYNLNDDNGGGKQAIYHPQSGLLFVEQDQTTTNVETTKTNNNKNFVFDPSTGQLFECCSAMRFDSKRKKFQLLRQSPQNKEVSVRQALPHELPAHLVDIYVALLRQQNAPAANKNIQQQSDSQQQQHKSGEEEEHQQNPNDDNDNNDDDDDQLRTLHNDFSAFTKQDLMQCTPRSVVIDVTNIQVTKHQQQKQPSGGNQVDDEQVSKYFDTYSQSVCLIQK